jgi:uncharacterized protein (TIGR00251 family)
VVDLRELELTEARDGVGLALRVRPGAKRDAILGLHGRALRVAVRAAPEKGAANEAALALIARAAGLARSAVRLVQGPRSRDKRVVVSGIGVEALRARLAADCEVLRS